MKQVSQRQKHGIGAEVNILHSMNKLRDQDVILDKFDSIFAAMNTVQLDEI